MVKLARAVGHRRSGAQGRRGPGRGAGSGPLTVLVEGTRHARGDRAGRRAAQLRLHDHKSEAAEATRWVPPCVSPRPERPRQAYAPAACRGRGGSLHPGPYERAGQCAHDRISRPVSPALQRSRARGRGARGGSWKSLGMGALLGVGMGSASPSKVVVMRWNGAPRQDAPLALVGKGGGLRYRGHRSNPQAAWRT